MSAIKDAAATFLSQTRIAVAGVSRRGDTAANVIYKKLRDSGYDVYPVNPNADTVEGDACFRSLAAIPGGVDAVVIGTPPAAVLGLVEECAELGIEHVWMHRSLAGGSVNDEAVRFCEEQGISVIPGSCPMMYCEPVDPAHKCIRWWLGATRKLPRPIGFT